MAKDSTKEKKGFTIIEVVLVLAIAGLIFLMVFVAFPALQRSRNDTQRRQDYSDLASNVMTEAGNTNGRLLRTSSADTPNVLDATMYVNKDGTDPSGALYQTGNTTTDEGHGGIQILPFPGENEVSLENNAGQVVIYYGSVNCGANGVTPSAGGAIRSFVVYGFMEGGNGRYCVANEY